MSRRSKALLVGGPMYDPLYKHLAEFEESGGLRVETVVAPTYPDLNEQIEAEFASGGASYNLISAHQIRPEPETVANPVERGIREALPGNKSVEKTLEDTGAAAHRTAEGA